MENSNEELKQTVKAGYEHIYFNLLSMLEIVFPHKKDDGSQNEKLFSTIRSKVLRVGNDKVRELDKLFESYEVFKLYDVKLQKNELTEKVIVDFRSQWIINTKKGEAK